MRKLHLVALLHRRCSAAGTRAAPARPGRGRAAARPARDRRGDRAAARPDRAAPAAAHRSSRSAAGASAGSSTASRATPRPHCYSRRRPRRRPAWSTPAPPASAWSPRRRSTIGAQPGGAAAAGRRDAATRTRSPPRSRCAPAARPTGSFLVGATIVEIDPDVAAAADGVVLRRLQPRAPARPPPRRRRRSPSPRRSSSPSTTTAAPPPSTSSPPPSPPPRNESPRLRYSRPTTASTPPPVRNPRGVSDLSRSPIVEPVRLCSTAMHNSPQLFGPASGVANCIAEVQFVALLLERLLAGFGDVRISWVG